MSSWRLFPLWLVLLDVRPTLTTVTVYKVDKGADLRVECRSDLDLNVTRRVFCKNDCEEDDVLVQTSGNNETNGRFSLEHEKKGSPPVDFITVKISNLSLSDLGRYRCFWDRPVHESFYEFKIDVIDDLHDSRDSMTVAKRRTRFKREDRACACTDIPPWPHTEPATPGCFNTGHTFRYKCMDGYVRKAGTSNLIRCGQDNWSKPSLKCIAFPDPPLTTPETMSASLEESKFVFSVAAGEEFSRFFAFPKPGKTKTFCRNNCSDDDILVETTGDEGKSGRYRIEYEKRADDLNYIYVTIRHVSVADSGVYHVQLDGKYKELWIEVTPASPGGVPVTVSPSAAPPGGVPVAVPPSTAPPGGVPVTVRPSAVAPQQEPTGSSGGAPETQNLVLILDLVLVCEIVIITGTIVIICCWRRSGRRSGAGGRHNPEREYENVRPESERIYEDLRLEEMEPTYSVLPGGVA